VPSKPQKERVSSDALDEFPDGELVKLVQKGDQDAYACLFRRYYPKVYSMALARLRNRENAQDVVQEAFIKVFRYVGSFKGNSSFYTWLYRITANLCIDRLRQASRDQQVEYIEGRKLKAAVERGGGIMGAGSMEGDSPERNLARKEVLAKLQEAIDELPDYHRDVILMREIGGMSYSEMAKAMKVSKGTIMSRLFHARRKVKERLRPYLEGEDEPPEDSTREAQAGDDE
jgi:RNA polymerase sigma-70 factor (ECF subfamily)